MLATLLTGLFLAVQALDQLSRRLSREEPPPYLVHQPLPWQLHSVTRNRRSSRDSEKGCSSRHSSIHNIYSVVPGRRGEAAATDGESAGGGEASSESTEASDRAEKAALTIQAHYHKYQQHKHQH